MYIFLIDEGLPTMISMSADAILKSESAVRKRELEDAAGTWDGKTITQKISLVLVY